MEWQDDHVGTPLDARDLGLVENGENGMRTWKKEEGKLVQVSRDARAARQRQNSLVRTIATTLVSLVVIVAGVAIWQGMEASKQARIAIGQQVARQAVLDVADHYDRALLLANTATQLGNDENAGDSLLRVVQKNDPRFIGFTSEQTNPVQSVAFSPDGKTLASGGRDFNVRLWKVSSRKQIGMPFTGHTGWVLSVWT